MKKNSHYVIYLSAVLLALVYTCPLSAAPHEATLFPDSAYITEVSKIRLQPTHHNVKKAVFVLPAKTDPASLTVGFVEPAKMQIDDFSWRQITPDDNDALKTLRVRFKKAQDDRNDLLGHIKSLEAQILFWQAQAKGKAKSSAEAANTVAAIGKNLRMLYREKFAKEPELEKADKRITDYQEEIDRQSRDKEPPWEITLLISGAQTGETTLEYSYHIGGCGWSPINRIEADTLAGKIVFKQQVRIWQNTLTEWNHIALRIAPQRPPQTVTPPTLGAAPSFETNTLPRKQKSAGMPKSTKTFLKPSDNDKYFGSLPVDETGRSIITSADLGFMDLPSHSVRTLTLQTDIRPADFTYLLKPSLSPHAFIVASVRQPYICEFPSVEALLLIDGAFVEKKKNAFSGQSSDLFFGIDPHVIANRRFIDQPTGAPVEEGNRNLRELRLDVKNTKSRPVKITVEEPLPLSSNSTMMTVDHFDPMPTAQDTTKSVWQFDLPAGGQKAISAFLKGIN